MKANLPRLFRRSGRAPLLLSWIALAAVPAVALRAAEPAAGAVEPDARAAEPGAAASEPAATAPAAGAAARAEAPAVKAAEIEAWFDGLGHPAASVRHEARTKLMGMGRGNLDAFRGVVEKARPLMPSQAAVLRQIVNHVYLAGEAYDAIGHDGFLGVRMQEVTVATPAPDPNAAARPPVQDDWIAAFENSNLRAGIVIVDRMPGFCGSRMLLDGDVILNTVDHPVRALTLSDFSTIVREVGAGHTIRFEVLRQGQVIQVAIRLDPRPLQADVNGMQGMQELVNRRRDKFDAYWEQTFKPLLQEGVG